MYVFTNPSSSTAAESEACIDAILDVLHLRQIERIRAAVRA